MIVNAFEDQKSADVAVKSNTANVKTEIFRLTAPDRIRYTLLSGTPFVIKLYDSTPTEIPANSELYISVKIPAQDTPIEIKKFSYAPFSNLSVAEQMNVDNQEALRIDIPRGKVTIEEVEAIIIELKSSSVVSWASGKGSTIQFEVIREPM